VSGSWNLNVDEDGILMNGIVVGCAQTNSHNHQLIMRVLGHGGQTFSQCMNALAEKSFIMSAQQTPPMWHEA